MSDQLREAVAAKIEADEVERVGDNVFIPIFSLESGVRYGLDDAGNWAAVEAQLLRRFEPGHEAYFLELLEHERAVIEAKIAEGAAAQALPADHVAWSLPVGEFVVAVCRMGQAHFCRLALLWLLPSELRELRGELIALSSDANLPRAVRDLASHLTVAVDQA